jgi:hypothetical protein
LTVSADVAYPLLVDNGVLPEVLAELVSNRGARCAVTLLRSVTERSFTEESISSICPPSDRDLSDAPGLGCPRDLCELDAPDALDDASDDPRDPLRDTRPSIPESRKRASAIS